MKNYMTIREAAAYIGLAEYMLRARLASRQLPGFYAGKRFYVNIPMLMDMLQKECEYYSGGGVEPPKPVRNPRRRPTMSDIDYRAKWGMIEALETEAEIADQTAELAMELRTRYDRGHFN